MQEEPIRVQEELVWTLMVLFGSCASQKENVDWKF